MFFYFFLLMNIWKNEFFFNIFGIMKKKIKMEEDEILQEIIDKKVQNYDHIPTYYENTPVIMNEIDNDVIEKNKMVCFLKNKALYTERQNKKNYIYVLFILIFCIIGLSYININQNSILFLVFWLINNLTLLLIMILINTYVKNTRILILSDIIFGLMYIIQLLWIIEMKEYVQYQHQKIKRSKPFNNKKKDTNESYSTTFSNLILIIILLCIVSFIFIAFSVRMYSLIIVCLLYAFLWIMNSLLYFRYHKTHIYQF